MAELPKKLPAFRSTIRGCNFNPLVSATVSNVDHIYMYAERDNPKDPNAIQVTWVYHYPSINSAIKHQ